MAFTYFFRDMHTLRLVERCVVPDLVGRGRIDVWDAGCAMGPEPYSLAIILRENMGSFLWRNVRIQATDLDGSDQFGEVIRRGVYPDEQVKRIPRPILDRYFAATAESGWWQVSEEIRARVHFRRHDLLTLEPVGGRFDLVVRKNVLLHFSEEQRTAVLRMFHSVLGDGGYLVMEQTQRLPDTLCGDFERVTGDGQVYRKAAAA